MEDHERKRRERNMRLQEGARQAMATPEGRALLRMLLAESRFLTAVPGGAAADALNHFEGRRAVGAKLYALLAEQDKRNIIILTEETDG